MKKNQDEILNNFTGSDYKFGFYTDIETDTIPKGLNEDTIHQISARK